MNLWMADNYIFPSLKITLKTWQGHMHIIVYEDGTATTMMNNSGSG